MNTVNISNINRGVCQHRATTNQPSCFVSWTQGNEVVYKYFSLPCFMYSLEKHLKEYISEGVYDESMEKTFYNWTSLK